MSSSFKDLRVWQEAMKLAADIYRATARFPKDEMYGITQQMRRAAVSMPSNIAEGKGYSSDAEFRRFLFHARGSLLELQTQVLLSQELQYLTAENTKVLLEDAAKVGRSLAGLINALAGEKPSLQ